MTDARPHLAKLATDALAAERATLSTPTPTHRARAIALVASAIETGARARRRRRWGVSLGGLAVAAAALVLVGALRHRAPTPSAPIANTPQITGSAHALAGDVEVVREGREMRLEGAQSIGAGDRVLARRDARAAVTLSTGTHLVVASGGDLGVVEQDATQIYALQSGSLHADVAKLMADQRFLVRTADAEIEVRGTSFDLSVVSSDPACGAGTATRLVVSEGVVVVRAAGVEARVAAGEKWPIGCETSSSSEGAAPSPVPIPSASATAQTPKVGATSGTSTPASELAAQNDLFAKATAAKNAGDTAGAIAGYERYLAKYPGGPLAESASVERMRLLASIDPRRAALAAKAYLAGYPNGFARVEAERLATEAP